MSTLKDPDFILFYHLNSTSVSSLFIIVQDSRRRLEKKSKKTFFYKKKKYIFTADSIIFGSVIM